MFFGFENKNKNLTEDLTFLQGDLNGVVVNVADCYHKGAEFEPG
jgi:hypothetical protein